ncbi:hypothetical protein [Priestia abyssalis]|uniref:hypothetical protein n=1 Tax=Priestia abyssalis TaxID=1221450 RepID=UPI000995CBF3|nr:hypothetical protein [Priestia abyssalis]
MIAVQLDEKEIEKIFIEELQKRLQHIERRRTLWDMKELCRQTCMSENTIKEKFFYDKRFPKYKIGGKWYFPAADAEAFLLMWIREQNTH